MSSPVAPRLLTLGTLALTGAGDAPSLGPHKLALLTYLARATRPLTRDHLAELFWGESDDRRARHSLRETLSVIRRVLGDEVIARGGDLVALADVRALTVDVIELRAASAAGDAATVIALRAGPFLDGVHVAGASPAFEEWLGRERADVERLFVDACAVQCRRLREAGDFAARAVVAERWMASAPLDARAGRALLRSLAAPGTRDALRRALDAHARLVERLDREFALAPDASVTALAEAYARELATPPAPVPVVVPEPPSEVVAPTRDGGPVARRWRLAAAGGAVALAALAAVAAWESRAPIHRPDGTDAPFVVVLGASGRLPDADCWVIGAVPQLIATALARATDMETVARPSAGCGAPAPALAADLDSARRDGATVVVLPTLTHTARGYALALDVHDLGSERALSHAVVTDTAPFGLAEHAAVVLASMLPGAPGERRADAATLDTRSVEAYLAYMDALRLLYDGRGRDAEAALDRAIAADSGFVVAVSLRLRSYGVPLSPASADSAHRLEGALERHMDRATPYDRLAYEVSRAEADGGFAHAEALAGELAERYPHDVRAGDRYVELMLQHGRVAEALDVVRRSIKRDSLARALKQRGAQHATCGLCREHVLLPTLLLYNGRADEAERAARRAVAALPNRPNVWLQLSVILGVRDKWDEAVAAADRAHATAPLDPVYAFESARRLVEAGRLDEAARRIHPWLSAPDAALAEGAGDVESARLRELGQHADAARLLARWARRDSRRLPGATDLVLASSLAADGDGEGAVAALTSSPPSAQRPRSMAEARVWRSEARGFAWSRAVLADALVIAADAHGVTPDTMRLRALADSIEVIGAQSYFGRDWLLHHHVRGLIASRAGRWAEAAAEFERSRWTPVAWSRTLVELARADLALGRPEQALAALVDARHASLDGMGRYVTRTEAAYWTALAFSAAGRPDSAAPYAARARAAWRDADPPVRRRLASLDRL